MLGKIKKAYLAKVGALLGDCEVALVIGAAEEARVLHVLRVLVVLLAGAYAYPEEILRLFTFSHHLHIMNRAKQ